MRVTVQVPDDIGDKVKQVADEQGVSVSSLYTAALQAYLNERKRAQAIKRVDALIGTYVASDADEQLKEIRKASDRSFG